MHVVLHPFFSQQDKANNRFLIESCGATKMKVFLAEQIIKDLGWQATLLLPTAECQTVPKFDPRIEVRHMTVPLGNLAQRLYWGVDEWPDLFADADIVITHHELYAWPLKNIFPRLKVVQFNGVPEYEPWPWMAPLFYESWRSADLIACYSDAMRQHIVNTFDDDEKFLAKTRIWPFAYDATKLWIAKDDFPSERDIDLLFVLRCSATNYTRHREFIQAVELLRSQGFTGKVGFTDTTHYLATSGEAKHLENIEIKESDSQLAYIKMLYRSKAVIGLNNNLYGGMAYREALACECFPIALRVSGYVSLLGYDWPYLIPTAEPLHIAEAVLRAFQTGLWESQVRRRFAIGHRVRNESFQSAWLTARADLEGLVR